MSLLPSHPSATTHPPLPVINALTEPFWQGISERKLMIVECLDCGHLIHVPRPVCNRCLSTNLGHRAMSGKATLYAYTVTVQAFHPYYVDKVPYVSAVVEFEEQAGLRMTTLLVDCPEDLLKVGLPVEVVWTDAGPDWVLPYFRPRPSQTSQTSHTAGVHQ